MKGVSDISMCKIIWRFPEMGYPQIIYFDRSFHYKPSTLGTYGNPHLNGDSSSKNAHIEFNSTSKWGRTKLMDRAWSGNCTQRCVGSGTSQNGRDVLLPWHTQFLSDCSLSQFRLMNVDWLAMPAYCWSKCPCTNLRKRVCVYIYIYIILYIYISAGIFREREREGYSIYINIYIYTVYTCKWFMIPSYADW